MTPTSPRSGVMTPGRSSGIKAGQSLMTSISEPEGQIDLKCCGKHRLLIINQPTNIIKIEDGHKML